MTYTIKFDLFLDDDNIYSDEEMARILEDILSSVSINVNNVRILEVND